MDMMLSTDDLSSSQDFASILAYCCETPAFKAEDFEKHIYMLDDTHLVEFNESLFDMLPAENSVDLIEKGFRDETEDDPLTLLSTLPETVPRVQFLYQPIETAKELEAEKHSFDFIGESFGDETRDEPFPLPETVIRGSSFRNQPGATTRERKRATAARRERKRSSSSCSSSLNSLSEGPIAEEVLCTIPTRELNKFCRNMPTEVVMELKQKRRTLKNRGYAQNCRQKRTTEKSELEKKVEQLEYDLAEMTAERNLYRKLCCKSELESGNSAVGKNFMARPQSIDELESF